MAPVKRATAIRHLVELADVASERLRLRQLEVGTWPLEELWISGDLLTDAESVEASSVVLALDVPADELPWLAIHPAGEWVGDQLHLQKRPFRWCYRPLLWPVWNHEHRRLVRFWSATGGPDGDVIATLRERAVHRLAVVEPSPPVLAAQLQEELVVSRRHLRRVLDSYWDHDWRREHKGFDASPEDHLWRAAQAVTELQDAVASACAPD